MEGYVEELLGANGRSPLQKNGGERPFAPTEEWRNYLILTPKDHFIPRQFPE